MSFEPNPEHQHKTETILAMMRATSIGDTLTYQDMRERLNEPVASQHYALRCALDDAKDEHMVFVNIPDVGYQRLSDAETATKGVRRHIRKVYRAAKRGLRTAAAIANPMGLTQGERVNWYAQRAVLESIKADAHGNSVNAKTKKTEREPSALEREMERVRAQGGVT